MTEQTQQSPPNNRMARPLDSDCSLVMDTSSVCPPDGVEAVVEVAAIGAVGTVSTVRAVETVRAVGTLKFVLM